MGFSFAFLLLFGLLVSPSACCGGGAPAARGERTFLFLIMEELLLPALPDEDDARTCLTDDEGRGGELSIELVDVCSLFPPFFIAVVVSGRSSSGISPSSGEAGPPPDVDGGGVAVPGRTREDGEKFVFLVSSSIVSSL